MNYEYDEAVLKCFLKQQKKLFSEPVASSMEEAEVFEVGDGRYLIVEG